MLVITGLYEVCSLLKNRSVQVTKKWVRYMDMDVCPLCNGLRQMKVPCKRCRAMLVDKGKVTDFLDDYSAYEDIDTLQQVDGIKGHASCVHYFYCESCKWDEQIVIHCT